MPAGPAALALRTGAPLVPVSTWFTGRPPDHGLMLQFEAPIEVVTTGSSRDQAAAMTQQLADVFAGHIADHPQDWHMLQRVFTADLTPR